MDNANIHLYKDGDDIIVVLKNAANNVDDILKLIFSSSDIKINSIPGVDEPVEEKMSKPENFNEYENILPDFLTDEDVGVNVFSEENDKLEPVEEKAKDKESDIIDDVKEAYPPNVFSLGKFEGMNPEDIVNSFGDIGFYELCAYIKTNTEDTILRKESINVVKKYYTDNSGKLGQAVKDLPFIDLEKIILTLYPISEKEIMEKVNKLSYSDISTYLSVESLYNVRGVTWAALRPLKEFINSI
jgi:hypothetical protein